MRTLTAMVPRPSWRVASLGAALLLLVTTWSGAGGTHEPASLGTHPMAAGVTLDPAQPAPSPGSVLPDRAHPADGGAMAEEGSPGDDSSPAALNTDAPAPRQTLEPAPLPDEVELHEPDLVVRSPKGLGTAGEIEGARYAAGVRELTATVTDRDGEPHELDLLAADPGSFRPLTPEVTAQSPSVWQRLDDGDVLVRHDVAHQLGLELGQRLRLEGEGGTTTVRIGALAANGAPPFADVVVPFEVASMLGSPGLNALIVAADDEPSEVAAALEELGDVELRRPPEPERTKRRPTSGSVELEPFTYTSRGDGTIGIHGDWTQRNIVAVDIPGMGTTRCHRRMVPQLYAALQEIADEGLYGHFRPEQFGGCWVPRHILWNPDRGLSMHAWGLAIDFNVQDNWYGDVPQMDRRIVAIFEKWGFEWGGHWSTPDGMHFELDRFVEVP